MQVEQEGPVSLLSHYPPTAGPTHAVQDSDGLSHLPAQTSSALWPRMLLPGINPFTPQGFLVCVRKSDNPGSLKSGAHLDPHAIPRSGCARHHRAPDVALPGRQVGCLTGQLGLRHLGQSQSLTMAVSSFPLATCCPQTPQVGAGSWPHKAAQDNSAVIHFLPGDQPHGLLSPWDSLPVDCQLHSIDSQGHLL